MPNNIVLASANPHKATEFAALFDNWGWSVKAQDQLGVSSVAETGTSFIENALIKAKACSQQTNQPALADDSGLIVDVLEGHPGVKSARYAGDNASDEANRQLVIQQLANIDDSPPFRARFVCVLVYYRFAGDPVPVIAQGQWEGEITLSPSGDQGFGYDPIFWLSDCQCTAAQLEPGHKNRISHRAQALEQLKNKICSTREMSANY